MSEANGFPDTCVCPHCRITLEVPDVELRIDQVLRCPQCRASVGNSARKFYHLIAFLLSAISIVLMYPAYTENILVLTDVKDVKQASLPEGTYELFMDGKVPLGMFILVLAMIAPALKNICVLLSNSGVSISARIDRWIEWFAHALSPWASLEVTMFSIVLILLNYSSELVQLYEGPALSAYFAMAVCTISASWFNSL